jgi:pimeloyl-ACP methyl ester carboxylesterase
MRFARLLLIVLALTAVFAASADARCSTAPRSWVAGSVDICRGTLVYSDYVHDDYGADTGASSTTSRTATLVPSAGDQAYTGDNDATADLVRLTLRIKDGRLVVKGLMNALFKPRQTTLALAIDTDHDLATGGGKWKGLDVSSRGWEKLFTFRRGNVRKNTISGSVPVPKGRRWRVQAATAISAAGQVMNVAFRGINEHSTSTGFGLTSSSGAWFEDKQAAALGKGEITPFGTSVRPAALRAHRTHRQKLTPGLHERVYRSRFTVPPRNEGVNVAGVPGRGDGGGSLHLGFEQGFQYLGHFQPYGIYIPKGRGPFGMQMVFHGSSSGFSALINQPGMQQRFGEELHRILVVPEARGQNGFGSDISERDLLDVMADVQRTYRIDRNKVFSGGYSQGGYVGYRMAELYPQRFAGLVVWVGFTGDAANGSPAPDPLHYTAGAVGNVIDFVGNLRWIPSSLLYAGGDELVQAFTAEAMHQAFAATDNVFDYYFHPGAEHLTFAALDDWRKEAADTRGLKLVRNPARVSYRTAAFLGNRKLGIRHDRAYWVSRIRGRGGPKTYQDVDLTTFACGGRAQVVKDTTGAGPDPVPWVGNGQAVASRPPLKKAARLRGSLTNVSSLRIDAGHACLRHRRFAYDLRTDGTTRITLTDGRALTLGGAGRHRGRLPR